MTAPQSETPPLLSGLYTDRYELSMAWVYWREGWADVPAVFDSLCCTAPAGRGSHPHPASAIIAPGRVMQHGCERLPHRAVDTAHGNLAFLE